MLKIKISKDADRFLKKIPAKHARQIFERIALLRNDPFAIKSLELKGFSPFCRFRSGEYRVIFRIDDDTLHITIIGKRNDDEVYKQLRRFLR